MTVSWANFLPLGEEIPLEKKHQKRCAFMLNVYLYTAYNILGYSVNSTCLLTIYFHTAINASIRCRNSEYVAFHTLHSIRLLTLILYRWGDFVLGVRFRRGILSGGAFVRTPLPGRPRPTSRRSPSYVFLLSTENWSINGNVNVNRQ